MPGASNGQCAHRERVRPRYAFRSPEKVALQEIGPRFTLKLRYIKKGLPAVKNLGAPSKPLEFDAGEDEEAEPKEAQEEGMDPAHASILRGLEIDISKTDTHPLAIV